MKASDKGIHLMHQFEGCRLRPYLCPATLWTIGFGRVLHQEQIRLPVLRKPGYTGMIRKEFPLAPEHNRKWTQEEVDEAFREDLARFEAGVLRLVPGIRGRQGAFDALVSFAYNAGLGNLQNSTVRMKANRGDWEGAAEALMMWTKGGGKELPGLVKRRKAEKALMLSDD